MPRYILLLPTHQYNPCSSNANASPSEVSSLETGPLCSGKVSGNIDHISLRFRQRKYQRRIFLWYFCVGDIGLRLFYKNLYGINVIGFLKVSYQAIDVSKGKRPMALQVINSPYKLSERIGYCISSQTIANSRQDDSVKKIDTQYIHKCINKNHYNNMTILCIVFRYFKTRK